MVQITWCPSVVLFCVIFTWLSGYLRNYIFSSGYFITVALFKANLEHVVCSCWTVFRILQDEYKVQKLEVFLVSSPLFHTFFIPPQMIINLSDIPERWYTKMKRAILAKKGNFASVVWRSKDSDQLQLHKNVSRQEKWFFKTPIFKPHRTEFLTLWHADCAWCGMQLQVCLWAKGWTLLSSWLRSNQ